jgi:ABC-type branched-subunit amino acid transport system substrate-binding protein
MRTPRLVAALAVSVVLTAGLAACSNSATSTTTGTKVAAADVTAGPATGWSDGGLKVDTASLKCGQTASDPTRGVTDTEITVGGLAYLTSPDGSSMSGAELGAKARFERANAEGGVNGRKINYTGTLDDGNDPARDSAQAKVLVEQKKVFAVVPEITSNANFLDTFCSKTVPFFGWGLNEGFCGTTIGFGITGCETPADKLGYTSTNYGLVIQAMFGGSTKGKTLALVGLDNDSARAGTTKIADQLRAVGVDVVYAQNPVPTSGLTDTTPVVNAIMTSNKGAPPDVVFYIADFSSVVKLTGALDAAGFRGKNLNPIGYDPRLASFKDLDQSYTVLLWEPGVDTSIPAIRQMADDFAKYAPGTTISLPAMAGYWAADMFVTAATKVGRNLTVDGLLKVLNNNYSNYVAGALPESRWPLNHLISTPCAATVQLTGGKYDVTGKLACSSLIKS